LFVQVVVVGLKLQMVVPPQRPHPEPSAAQMDCPSAFVVRPSMLAMYRHVEPTVVHEVPGQNVEPQACPDLQVPPEQTCPVVQAVPPVSHPDPVGLQVRTVLPSQPSWFGVQSWATHVPAEASQYWVAVHVASVV
jgi:hypothetical protein